MSSLQTPDLNRMIADLRRRIEILERRQRPATPPAAAAAGGDVHDGTGTGSTITVLSANSPVAAGDYAVAIGHEADADGVSGIAIGGAPTVMSSPHAQGQGGIAIGSGGTAAGASAVGAQSVAIGAGELFKPGAKAGGNWTVAIGFGARSDGLASVTTGYDSVATGEGSAAFGAGARSLHANAAAIGDNVVTTASGQVTIGAKRLFAGAPATAPADANLLAGQFTVWVDQTANTLTFKVKYGTGVVKSGTVALT